MDDMGSVVPRALKGSSMECRQTRERSNGRFLINSTLCEDSHVLTGYAGELSQDMMVLSSWRSALLEYRYKAKKDKRSKMRRTVVPWTKAEKSANTGLGG